MRLLSLDITNFRVIRSARLEITDSLTGIIGPNGAGKSSLIEAVAWSLYGNRVARSGKDEIKSTFAPPDESCEVALTFEIGGEHYRIVRRLIGKTERPEVALYRGARSESVGSTETLKHVTGLLGLDWRGFLSSFLARQQELNALADLQPGQRREHLAGMLGIERLDKALQRVKEDGKLYQRSAEMIERQVRERDAVAEQIRQLGEQANTLVDQRDSTAGAYEKARRSFTEIETAYGEHQKREAACSRIKASLKAGKQAVEHQGRQLDSLNKKAAELGRAAEELKQLEKALADYDRVKSEFEKAARAKQAVAHRGDLKHQLEQSRRESKWLADEQARVEPEAKKIGDQLAAIPDRVTDLHKEAVSRLEQARDEWNQASASLKVVKADVKKVEAQIGSMNQIGPEAVCDRCHRPFGDDLPKIKKHLQDELSELAANRARIETDLSKLTAKGEGLKKEAADLEAKSRKHYELTLALKSAEERLKEIVKRQKDLGGRMDQLTGQLSKLGEAEFDPKAFTDLEQQLSRLEQKRSRAQELKGRLGDRPEVEREIKAGEQRLADLKAETEKLERELAELGFDEEAFARLQREFNAAREKLDRAKDDSVKAATQLEVVNKTLELRKDELAKLEKAAEELEEYRTNQYYAEKLVRLFGDFRKYTISRIRPRLAQLSSDLMLEMSDGRYSMVELDSDYNLRLMDYGQYYGIDRYSGGEKDLASLCLRLAISLALTESAGLDRSFVILDEVFGSQDEQRRDLIFQALAGLKGRFPQILLVTHLEELKHRVETLVEVRPTGNGWSEVTVNGNGA